MNGILIIDKPRDHTSHDVVARARGILQTKRIGHTGTLDPFATGVLVLLVGRATRLARFLDKDEKEYQATIRFGYETDTGDATGSARANSEIPMPVSVGNLETVLTEFRGEIEQAPPMYSAKKIGGKKLYELARKGIEVERKSLPVTISELEILDRSVDTAVVRVVCSAGTFIRTLAEDIGRHIGTGAHLEELRRTRAGRFDLSRSLTLEQLQALKDPASALIEMSEAVSHLPKLILSADRVDRTRSGLASRYCADLPDDQPVRMVDDAENLIAVGVYREDEGVVQPKVVLI